MGQHTPSHHPHCLIALPIHLFNWNTIFKYQNIKLGTAYVVNFCWNWAIISFTSDSLLKRSSQDDYHPGYPEMTTIFKSQCHHQHLMTPRLECLLVLLSLFLPQLASVFFLILSPPLISSLVPSLGCLDWLRYVFPLKSSKNHNFLSACCWWTSQAFPFSVNQHSRVCFQFLSSRGAQKGQISDFVI